MKKAAALKAVNALLGLAFLVQVVTALLHDQLPYEVFRGIHVVGGYLMAACVVVHVALNWGWIRANYLKRSQPPQATR